MHGNNRKGMVLSIMRSIILLALVRVLHWVAGWQRVWLLMRVLCQLVLRLFMCLFKQHDNRWMDVSLWKDVHMSC